MSKSNPRDNSTSRDAGFLLAGVIAVPLVTFGAVSGGPNGVVTVLVVAIALASVVAALSNKPVLLIGLLVAASACQRALSALTGSSLALWLDDAVLIGFVVYIVIRLSSRLQGKFSLVLTLVVFVSFLGVALLRSTELSVGFYQLRQVGVPAILLLFGMMVDREALRRASPVVVGFIAVGALYGVLELGGLRLIDPATATGLNAFSTSSIRENGLPAAYRYFLSDGVVLSRVGGLVLNPPSFGILAASGLLWLRFSSMKRGVAFYALAVLFCGMTIASLGRGGFVVLGLALVQPLISRYSGRLAFAVVGLVMGFVAYSEISTQGQSGRHAEGFLFGLTYALTHPLGGGFGLVGNSVASLELEGAASGAAESLAAIFLTAIGWIGLIILAWLLVKGVGAGRTIPGVALTAAVLITLFSETAGGLDAAGPLWILAGAALTQSSAREVIAGVVARGKTDVVAHPRDGAGLRTNIPTLT
ncbi:hypothetical protein [Herbiconiux sp. VKM Ac-2851]|uniref:hypothetical protein n=1 Tax=Herbiconiux sp. VKM Ac-2851 TaxID=2739025 RepID=UPI001566A2D9|nr:hypothetical protein [Herbiconiux sp. VKM Ac-2851]NQX35568.1 hypothetical protein [Herbiconiux sp. VKM Ac-2851]